MDLPFLYKLQQGIGGSAVFVCSNHSMTTSQQGIGGSAVFVCSGHSMTISQDSEMQTKCKQ